MKVAIVTESLWKMAGGARITSTFASMYKDADIYCLFGHKKLEDRKKYLDKELCRHNFYFSPLNNFPFIKKNYRYTFPLWRRYIENFDFHNYDLVISCSSSVAHGVITPLDCKHISYIHTPVRYAWDMYDTYFNKKNFIPFITLYSKKVMHDTRIWDVCASNRSDVLLCNSNFVKERIKKVWRKDAVLIYPPVTINKTTNKNIINKREDYYIVGAPFDHNKGGDFILHCAKELKFNLKIIGDGNLFNKLKNKYKNCKNIEFLGWVEEEEKFKLLSNAKGFIMGGIEDYGIFCAEAISCGTPVIAYKNGGSLEIVKKNKSGMFFDNYIISDFQDTFDKFNKHKWNYKEVQNSLTNYNTKESFVKKAKEIISSC
ncbi:glycosyltransferase [bacterium]|nr:glycosyltransferase [bacterium]